MTTIIRGIELPPEQQLDFSTVVYRRQDGSLRRFRFQIFVPDRAAPESERPKMYTREEWEQLINPFVKQTLEKTAYLTPTILAPNQQREYRLTPQEILLKETNATQPQKLPVPDEFQKTISSFIDSVITHGECVPLFHFFGIKNEGNTCFLAAALQLILSTPGLSDRICASQDPKFQKLRNFLERATKPSYSQILFGVSILRSTLEELKGSSSIDWLQGQHDSAEAYQLISGCFAESEHFPPPFSLLLVEDAGSAEKDLEQARQDHHKAQKHLEQLQTQSPPPSEESLEKARKDLATKARDLEFATQRTQTPPPSPASFTEEEFQRQLNRSLQFQSDENFPPPHFTIVRQHDSPLKTVASLLEITGTHYQLTAFSCHLGPTRTSGHYIAYRCIEGSYYKFDDERVEQITQKAFLEASCTASNFLYTPITSS